MTLMNGALAGNGLLSHDPRGMLRAPVRLPATLLMYRERYEVIVTDISANGAMVRGHEVPRKGDEVVLSRGAMQIVATVAWDAPHACGLAFHRPIDPEELIRSRDRRGMKLAAS